MTRSEILAVTAARVSKARRTQPCPTCRGSLATSLVLTTDARVQPEWIDGAVVTCHVLIWQVRCRGCRGLVSLEQPVPMNMWEDSQKSSSEPVLPSD